MRRLRGEGADPATPRGDAGRGELRLPVGQGLGKRRLNLLTRALGGELRGDHRPGVAAAREASRPCCSKGKVGDRPGRGEAGHHAGRRRSPLRDRLGRLVLPEASPARPAPHPVDEHTLEPGLRRGIAGEMGERCLVQRGLGRSFRRGGAARHRRSMPSRGVRCTTPRAGRPCKRPRHLTLPEPVPTLRLFRDRPRSRMERTEDRTVIPALMPTYARADLAFVRGEGARLWAEDGRRFLDFGSGIATSSLGHAHPHLVRAIADQAAKVMHVSNLYRIPQAERLAARHVAASFADSVFFCNSGAEANEGMIKAMRRTMAETGRPERYRIITFEGAFHGRTLATLAATGNPKYLDGFGPKVDGFDQVAFGNMNAVRDAITPATAGVIIEPVQGEGGVRPAELRFLRELRAMCDEYGLLLGLDEVQIGMGRSGKLWAYQWAGIEPDVMSAAKGIGGGFPLGAILAKEHVAKHLKPGTHGTTYGGNPLACAAGNAVLDVILADGFLDRVDRVARHLWRGLLALKERNADLIEDVRGAGLLLGIRLREGVLNTDLQAAAVAEGLLTVAAGQNVLRLAPPLIITEAEADEAVMLLERALARMREAAVPKAAAQ